MNIREFLIYSIILCIGVALMLIMNIAFEAMK